MKELIIGLTAGMIAGVALGANPKVKKMMEKAKAKMDCCCNCKEETNCIQESQN